MRNRESGVRDQGPRHSELRSSSNFDARDPAIALQFIILHYTGMPSGVEALGRDAEELHQRDAAGEGHLLLRLRLQRVERAQRG